MPDYGTTTPTAGWYTDPANATLERWWGGVEWTHDTRPIAVIATPEPALAAVPGGGMNPFAAEATPSWGTSTTPVTQAQSVGSYHAEVAVAGPPRVAAGWYDQGRIAQAQPATNPAGTRSLVFAILSWFFNPLFIFTIVALTSAKRGLENAQMFEYERREPAGRGAAKAARSLAGIALTLQLLLVAATGTGFYLLNSYHDFVLEGYWSTQATAFDLPGSTLDCPAEGSFDNGSSFTCTITLADGLAVPVTITINDFWARDFSFEPGS